MIASARLVGGPGPWIPSLLLRRCPWITSLWLRRRPWIPLAGRRPRIAPLLGRGARVPSWARLAPGIAALLRRRPWVAGLRWGAWIALLGRGARIAAGRGTRLAWVGGGRGTRVS